jgi:hypothetical protein
MRYSFISLGFRVDFTTSCVCFILVGHPKYTDKMTHGMWHVRVYVPKPVAHLVGSDLCPKFPPALRGVLGVKSLALGRHLVHRLSLQKLHRCQIAQC